MNFVKGMMKENDEKREKDSKENGNNIKEFLLE